MPNRRGRSLALVGSAVLGLAALAALLARPTPPALTPVGVEGAGPPPASASVVASAALAPSAVAVASAPVGRAPRPAHCPTYEAAMARGRALARAQNHDAAAKAFGEAIDVRPLDPRAWAERGYALLMTGASGIKDFRFARSLAGGDRALLAQIWFNEATMVERAGKAEEARLALAAAAHYGSKAAVAKLGRASRCAASWGAEGDASRGLASGWRELLKQRGPSSFCPSEGPEPTTEEGAKALVCRGCGYGNSDEGDQCQGPTPWRISDGYQHFHYFYFEIDPLPGGLFYLANGSEKRSLRGRAFVVEEGPSWEQIEGWFHPDGEEPGGEAGEGQGGGAGADAGAAGAALARCEPESDPGAGVELGTVDAMGMYDERTLRMRDPRRKEIYDLRTGRLALVLTDWVDAVDVSLDGDEAIVRGGGCDERVPLAR